MFKRTIWDDGPGTPGFQKMWWPTRIKNVFLQNAAVSMVHGNAPLKVTAVFSDF